MKKFQHKSLGVLLISMLVLAAILTGVSSCKAWRTITTTASYVQVNDSTKTSSTITTKTLEEYTGVKKN